MCRAPVPAINAECNCRCVTTGNCTGYTWLAENSTCYMLRNIQTFIDPDDDPNPGTTLGRVVSGESARQS